MDQDSHDYPDPNSSASPCVMTICGAAGDLTKRKLIPALCNLAQEKLLPAQFAIVGFAVDDFTTESFRKNLVQEIPKYAASPIDPKLLDWMCERIYYLKGDFQDPEAYQRLEQQIAEADRKYNALGNRLFYLAVAPRFFSPIVKMLGLCCLSKEESGRKGGLGPGCGGVGWRDTPDRKRPRGSLQVHVEAAGRARPAQAVPAITGRPHVQQPNF